MDLISYLFWLAVAFAIASPIIQRLRSEELRKTATYTFWAHALAAPALILVTQIFLRGGDIAGYYRVGSAFAGYAYEDFGRWAPEFVKLALRLTARVPYQEHGTAGATSTGAMIGFATWTMIFAGKSFYGGCLIISMLNYFSRFAIYLALRDVVPRKHENLLMLCCLAVPSAVFWTAGLFKEGVAMTGFGWCVYGISLIARRRGLVRGTLIFLIGAVPIYAVKVYILIPLILGGTVWFASDSLFGRDETGRVRIRPIYLLLAIGLGFVGMSALAVLAPQYSFTSVSDELAGLQTVGARVSGNTNYSLGQVAGQSGFAAQIALAPIALFFALTRPFFFEINNAQVLVNAIESTALTYFLFRNVIRAGIGHLIQTVFRNPAFFFVIIFVGLFGTAVGLGSTNVGSLSRYRAPMMPFFAILVFVVPALASSPASETQTKSAATTGRDRPRAGRRRGIPVRATVAARHRRIREMATRMGRRTSTPERVRARRANQRRAGRS